MPNSAALSTFSPRAARRAVLLFAPPSHGTIALSAEGTPLEWAICKPVDLRASHGPEANISLAKLEEMAASYDPERIEAAAINVDHVKEGPALGWIQSLAVRDGILWARPVHLSAEARDRVAAGGFRRVSIEADVRHEVTGGWYLTGLALLGAQRAAVKGLPPIHASEVQAQSARRWWQIGRAPAPRVQGAPSFGLAPQVTANEQLSDAGDELVDGRLVLADRTAVVLAAAAAAPPADASDAGQTEEPIEDTDGETAEERTPPPARAAEITPEREAELRRKYPGSFADVEPSPEVAAAMVRDAALPPGEAPSLAASAGPPDLELAAAAREYSRDAGISAEREAELRRRYPEAYAAIPATADVVEASAALDRVQRRREDELRTLYPDAYAAAEEDPNSAPAVIEAAITAAAIAATAGVTPERELELRRRYPAVYAERDEELENALTAVPATVALAARQRLAAIRGNPLVARLVLDEQHAVADEQRSARHLRARHQRAGIDAARELELARKYPGSIDPEGYAATLEAIHSLPPVERAAALGNLAVAAAEARDGVDQARRVELAAKYPGAFRAS